MPSTPELLLLQGNPSVPDGAAVDTGTDLIVPPVRTVDRLRHFSPTVYRLDAETALVRFLRVMLGESGVGQLRKKYLLRRLQQTLQGTHFFDLDRFYGALFGVQRRASEHIAIDPYSETATAEEWETIHAADAAYRSRIQQFSRAISFGASPVGMELVAEALLSVDCDIYESYRDVDDAIPGVTNRRMFTVRPKRAITPEEHYDVIRVLSRLKPADAFAVVDAEGVAVHSALDLRGVASDSEHWEIISKVEPRQVTTDLPYPVIDVEPREQPRVPFGGYQGEAWTYNGDVSGLVAYYRFEGTDKSAPVQEQVFTPNPKRRREKVYVSYPPENAMASQRDIIAGRYISDAVYQAHPYGTPRLGRTDVYVTEEGQVYALLDTGQAVRLGVNYVDNLPIPGLLEALRQLPTSNIDPGASGPQRFWLSPPRPIENQFKEVFEVRLNAPRYINYVGAKTSHYPHVCAVEVFDESTQSWSEVYRNKTTDSIPSIPPREPAVGSREHPLHPDSSSHWVTQSARFDQRKASRVRIVMWRTVQGSPPTRKSTSTSTHTSQVSSPTTTVSFGSAAEMNAFRDSLFESTSASWYNTTSGPAGNSITYNVPSTQSVQSHKRKTRYKPIPYSLALRDVEIGFRISSVEDVPLEPATTTDLLGSLVRFDLRTNPASNAISEDETDRWRSEPQPAASAIVNFWADTRDAEGASQTVDRFYLDPLYPGPHVSLYYSNDDIPDGEVIRADDDALNFPIVSPTGTIDFEAGFAAVLDTDDPSYIDIDNKAVQFDPTKDFHAFVAVTTGFAYNVGHHVFFDLGGYKLHQEGSLLKFEHPDETEASVSVDFPAGANLNFILEGNAEEVTISVGYLGNVVTSTAVANTPVEVQPTLLRVGAPISGSADEASFNLRTIMLKRGAFNGDTSFLTATLDIARFITRAQAPSDTDPTNNAILRFSPSFLSDDNDYGFKGGPGRFYDLLDWTPIARDFTVQKGFLHIPPTRAKFWKFEFTNLVAEPYDSFIPIDRVMKQFPEGTSRETMWQTTNSDPSAGPPGQRAAIDLGDRLFIENFIQVANVPDTTSPTEARYFRAPSQQDRARQADWVYGFKPWHMGLDAPSFDKTGPHEYEQVEVRHSEKVAFFCGLKEFGAYRVDYMVDDDTTVYYERFFDAAHLNSTDHPNTWTMDPGHLSNGEVDDAQVRSVVFDSAHDVVGVQFATHQSHPVQIVYDHDLKDPALATYDFSDTDQWHKLGDAQIVYEPNIHSLRIERTGLSTVDGEDEGATVRLVAPLLQPTFSRDYVTAAEEAAAASAFGGVETPPAVASELGMIHLAARFTSITDTSGNPYYLQLVTDTGTLIAERALPGRAGQVIEEYISYEIGTIVAAGTAVRGRLLQKTKVASTISLDTLSIFDDGIVWDFSVDGGATFTLARGGVRNNPYGVVTFPTPGKQLVWRARASRTDMHLTSVQVRPIYAGLRAYRPSGIMHGPNLSTYDQEPPVEEDPEFQTWSKPVPFWWWRESRRFPSLPVEGLPATSEFARFYGRPVEDDVSNVGSAADRVFFAFRSATDTVATPTDTVGRQTLLIRTASDSAPASDSVIGVRIPTGSALISKPIHPPISDDI